MDRSIPEFVKNIFKDQTGPLCLDLQRVESLIHSRCEWERAGALVIFATQFDIAREVVLEKLKRFWASEESHIVKSQIIYFISELEMELHFKERNAEIAHLAEANFATQLLRVRNGTYLEKLGAIKFAELRNKSAPNVARELYDYALLDKDSQVRCAALQAMSAPYEGTANKAIGAIFANLALNEKETDEVRVCAAHRILSIFKPVGISRGGAQILPPLDSDMQMNLLRKRNLIKHGVQGIDRKFIESCLTG